MNGSSNTSIWGLRTSVWFGICLAAVLLFLWCLTSMLEHDGSLTGYIWGLIIFGLVAIAAGAIALIGFSNSGGVARGQDRLLKSSSIDALRPSAGRGLTGSGYRPTGAGELPRASMGRKLK